MVRVECTLVTVLGLLVQTEKMGSPPNRNMDIPLEQVVVPVDDGNEDIEVVLRRPNSEKKDRGSVLPGGAKEESVKFISICCWRGMRDSRFLL